MPLIKSRACPDSFLPGPNPIHQLSFQLSPLNRRKWPSKLKLFWHTTALFTPDKRNKSQKPPPLTITTKSRVPLLQFSHVERKPSSDNAHFKFSTALIIQHRPIPANPQITELSEINNPGSTWLLLSQRKTKEWKKENVGFWMVGHVHGLTSKTNPMARVHSQLSLAKSWQKRTNISSPWDRIRALYKHLWTHTKTAHVTSGQEKYKKGLDNHETGACKQTVAQGLVH